MDVLFEIDTEISPTCKKHFLFPFTLLFFQNPKSNSYLSKFDWNMMLPFSKPKISETKN